MTYHTSRTSSPNCSLLCLQFPYYTFVNKERMYSVGSLFYAIYFFVSFPMFFRIDEDMQKGEKWTLPRVALDRCEG